MIAPGARPVVLNPAPGVPLYGPSGASAHVRAIVRALAPATVYTARTVDRRGEVERVSAPVVEVGVPGWPSWLDTYRDYTEVIAARRIARAAIADPPTLLWERHSLYSDAGWKVHTATGAPWILEVNAPLAEERLRYERLRRPDHARAWERDVVAAAPRVIAVSAWLADWARALGARDVRHVPNGVDPGTGDRAGARAAMALEDSFVLGFFGSGRPWHGVGRLAELLDAIPDAVGLVVGEARVEHPRARHVGVVTEARARDLVAAMDVGLAPYGRDAPPWFCPLKVLAYRAQGTPVVAADVGDTSSLVGAGGTVLPTWNLDDAVDACRVWRGRRPPPWVRGWDAVVREALGEYDGA